MRVRALYLDIAHWAVDDPARWAQWAALCPISGDEVRKAKERKHRKARMDQRTRERLPVLPTLVHTANGRRAAAARLLARAEATEPGEVIDGTNGTLRKAITRKATGRHVWANAWSSRGGGCSRVEFMSAGGRRGTFVQMRTGS